MSSDLNQRRGKTDKEFDVAEKVIVAVKASKDISRNALVWALTHVAQPGDCITLLVVVPAQSSGRKLWSFPRFAGDCASGHKKLQFGATLEMRSDITDSCSQMMLKLHDVYDSNKINVKIKIVSGSPCGAVATESKRVHASWVVLDKHLKHERKQCMEELQCNIVVMKRSQAKVLRLNLVGSPETETHITCPLSPEFAEASTKTTDVDSMDSERGPNVTPTSSPELGTIFTSTEAGTPSVSSSDPGTSPFLISERNCKLKKEEPLDSKECQNSDSNSANTGSDNEHPSPSTNLGFQPWFANIESMGRPSSRKDREFPKTVDDKTQATTTKSLMEKLSKLDMEFDADMLFHRPNVGQNINVRDTVSLSRIAPPAPPPLCTVCLHKAPLFGKPPRAFTYGELELATCGFSQANFLAEGGFGSVYKGILPDGQAVAVKQHKLASSQGDLEFCSEVEVLSCAQHRNVVTLIGFCVEDQRRLLVYEYICNGSLDSHLYGQNCQPLEWLARHKIAVGAARGLRYLHEECRVGCIVHRDMRPNNILITHDFEPLVGDFGLARWQPDGDLGVETRVIGTFGYLAPEYAQSGQITEKADVYSFGVVLVELVTGRKAVDINRPKGQQCLTEWARPLLEHCAINELVDPRLGKSYSEQDVYCLLHAASLCIRRDPRTRPRMSQVLRILEGDTISESNYSTAIGTAGSKNDSKRIDHVTVGKQHSGRVPCQPIKDFGGRQRH